MLWDRADAHPDSLFVRALQGGDVRELQTYEQVRDSAARWAAALEAAGLPRRGVVPLGLPNGADFVGAYFGILAAGGVPAPMPPLRRVAADDPFVTSMAERARFVDARVLVLADETAHAAALEPFAGAAGLAVVTPREAGAHEAASPVRRRPDELALVQFTSGTTGAPKAVQLTDAALLAQMRAIKLALALDDPEVDWAVSWLPLYHDMGLIGFLLTPAFVSGHVTLLRPEDFITDPTLWIKALSDFSATITGGPPSAYQLCTRRLKHVDVEQYDLRRVRIALVGAEMVTAPVLEGFARTFAPAGFRATSLMPTYGMAENGLAVTIPPLDRGPRFDAIDRAELEHRGRAVPVDGSHPPERTRTFAAVGGPVEDVEIEIVDAERRPVPERHVGEVAVRGPSVMKGYLHDEESTRAALDDGRLLTGDLGYLADGELHVVGRTKEILIVGGRNYQPGDLEELAASLDGVFRNRVVAFSYYDAERASEAVAIVAETKLLEGAARTELTRRIRQALTSAGYPVSDVVVVPPKTIRATPNGKLRRAECRARYLAEEFSRDGA
jgi:acyl-CoA synthetase (AMP-forming)/AMP-acid ligase II